MNTLSLKIPFFIIKKGKDYLAYNPSFDIITAGNTVKHAKKQFEEMVGLYFEGLQEMGTLEEALKNAGYHKTKRSWQSPRVITHDVQSIAIPA